MATPIVERRKVIIEYENRITNDLGSQDGNRPGQAVDAALVEAVRRELIKIGDRNGDIFGGRAWREVADNKTIDNGALTDFTAATDEIGGVDYQRVKLVDGTDGSTAEIQGTAANGLEVDVTRLPALTAGTAFAGKFQITDGTTDASVRNLAANDALNVAIVDGSGAQVTSIRRLGRHVEHRRRRLHPRFDGGHADDGCV